MQSVLTSPLKPVPRLIVVNGLVMNEDIFPGAPFMKNSFWKVVLFLKGIVSGLVVK
jgi:hypothetical protein